jgi:hypothetical protein
MVLEVLNLRVGWLVRCFHRKSRAHGVIASVCVQNHEPTDGSPQSMWGVGGSQAAALLIRIRWEAGSNLGWDTDSLDRCFYLFSSFASGECQDSTLK